MTAGGISLELVSGVAGTPFFSRGRVLTKEERRDTYEWSEDESGHEKWDDEWWLDISRSTGMPTVRRERRLG